MASEYVFIFERNKMNMNSSGITWISNERNSEQELISV